MVSEANQDVFTEKAREVCALLEFNYPRYAILAAGMGTELLLSVLFDELNEHYKKNDVRSSYELRDSLDKVRKEFNKNYLVEKNLTFQHWVFRYDKGEFVRRLSEAFGYAFNEFSISAIDHIREMRNKCAHPNYYEDQDAIDHKIETEAEQIKDSFLRLLFETNRITQSRAIVLNNPLEHQSEMSVLKREYDDVLRINPDEVDVLFLRAHLLRGEHAALDDLQRILILNPNHFEARKERIWNLNSGLSEEPATHQSSPHLTQINISSERNYFFISKVTSIRNILPNTSVLSNFSVLSNVRFSFRPTFKLFDFRISERAARQFKYAAMGIAIVVGVVLVLAMAFAAVMGLAVLDVLKQSPHLPGLTIVIVFVVILWSLFRRV